MQHQHHGGAAVIADLLDHSAVDTTPLTDGTRRRDCRAADRATARQRRRPLSTLAGPSQRATQRDACQATNASAPTSVASSIASSERSDFGSACTTVTDGRAADSSAVLHAGRQPALGDVLDDAVRHRARAVAQVQLLAGPDPAHIGRVETLVAVDHRELADRGQRVDVEQRAHAVA